MFQSVWRSAVVAVGVAAVGACGSSHAPGGAGSGGGVAPPSVTDARLAQCARSSPYLSVGAGRDAPGRLEVPTPPRGAAPGACAGSSAYRFGAGLHDITGPVAYTTGAGWVNPAQVFKGLHTRQYARAFAILSPCNGKRVMFVSNDQGLMFGSIRYGVLERIAADPELAPHYGPDNLMISVTHTHQGPTGYSHYDAPNALTFGYDQAVVDVLVQGTYEAIRRAHASLEAAPQAGTIALAIGEQLDTNLNRSKPAFALNPAEERAEFSNARGEEIDVNKRVVQLNLRRADGTPAALINWFGVHPTILGPELSLVGSDHKGYSSLGFERIMRTDYAQAPGAHTFVAAFAQADEGDSSPNLFIEERPYPDPARGGGVDPYESNAIAGTKSLAKALELFAAGAPLSGPVDYRLFHVQMDAVEVTDPVVLASLRHPPELDSASKVTCAAALGLSMAAGAEDGPGPSQEGISCSSPPDLIAAAQRDAERLGSGNIPPNVFGQAVLCNVSTVPTLACQAEKPVLFVLGPPQNSEPAVLPFQLLRIGNLAVLGLPWEVTTMAARRIRRMLLEILAPAGIDTVVVAGLVNDYIHYLTTREEYSSQQYEGASTVFGPWSLAAVQQESRRLAIALRDDAPAPDGPDYVQATPTILRPPYVPSDTPGEAGAFGTLVVDVPQGAAPGDTVRAEFVAGHPRNDLRLQSSYVFVERERADGSWEVVATDRDPALWFVWKPQNPWPIPTDPVPVGPSTAEAVWHVPRDTAPGVYRLRHVGAARLSEASGAEPYEGVSSAFAVAGAVADCP